MLFYLSIYMYIRGLIIMKSYRMQGVPYTPKHETDLVHTYAIRIRIEHLWNLEQTRDAFKMCFRMDNRYWIYIAGIRTKVRSLSGVSVSSHFTESISLNGSINTFKNSKMHLKIGSKCVIRASRQGIDRIVSTLELIIVLLRRSNYLSLFLIIQSISLREIGVWNGYKISLHLSSDI